MNSRLIQEKEKHDQLRLNDQSTAFSIINIARQISELQDVYNSNPSNASLEQLLEWKTNQHIYLKKFDKIAVEYKELLKTQYSINNDRMILKVLVNILKNLPC